MSGTVCIHFADTRRDAASFYEIAKKYPEVAASWHRIHFDKIDDDFTGGVHSDDDILRLFEEAATTEIECKLSLLFTKMHAQAEKFVVFAWDKKSFSDQHLYRLLTDLEDSDVQAERKERQEDPFMQ